MISLKNEQVEIRNKLESIEKIKVLGLNKFSEQLFKKGEEKEIEKFLLNNSASYYAIRDKSKAGGIFKLKVKKEDVLKEVSDYDLFTINVSSANYSENQLLVGEIQILRSGEVYAILSTNKNYSVRDATRDPEFNLKTDLFDDENLKRIPYFSDIFSYIVDHELYDIIVEFSLFDCLVGEKLENVIVYELRTHY